MTRPSRDETMMNVASEFAKRSTCARRQVGCVLTDKYGRTLSTGHNGVAMGQIHCTNVPCPGANCASGTGLDACQALHAEQNALLFTSDVMKIDTCYVTTSCCTTCVKLLLNTTCQRIVYKEEYPHPEAKELWINSGRMWHKYNPVTKFVTGYDPIQHL